MSDMNTSVHKDYGVIRDTILEKAEKSKWLAIKKDEGYLNISPKARLSDFRFNLSVPERHGLVFGIYLNFTIPLLFTGGILYKPQEIQQHVKNMLESFDFFLDACLAREDFVKEVLVNAVGIERGNLHEGSNTVQSFDVTGKYPYHYHRCDNHVNVYLDAVSQVGYTGVVTSLEKIATGIYLGHLRDAGYSPEDIDWTIVYETDNSVVLTKVSMPVAYDRKGIIKTRNKFRQFFNPTFRTDKKVMCADAHQAWWKLIDPTPEIENIINNHTVNSLLHLM